MISDPKHDPKHDPIIDPKDENRAHAPGTRPTGPSNNPGQLNRDNVNPNIPDAPQGEGSGIVDPNSLGMEQSGGLVPPQVTEQVQEVEHPHSINEPPGSEILPPVDPPIEEPPPEEPPPEEDLSDPDELEDQLDQAVEEGDAKKLHRGGHGKPNRPRR